ncbi:MAG: hypothetical protein GY754_08245 [bacterium]|nr:hypothetical protein [bacterium]
MTGVAALTFSAFTISCDNIDPETELPADNTHCPNGGVSIDSGIDENGDGVLDPDEVDNTDYVCNGEDGADLSTEVSALQTGITELKALVASQSTDITNMQNTIDDRALEISTLQGTVNFQAAVMSEMEAVIDSQAATIGNMQTVDTTLASTVTRRLYPH